MNEGLYIAASGGAKQLKKLDVLSNNIANINTPGFKKDLLIYRESTTQNKLGNQNADQWISPLLEKSNGLASYVSVTHTLIDNSQGSLVKTDNSLDLALEGEGYFAIATPTGERYTRNGHFHLDDIGQLVDQTGNPVQTINNDPIIIPLGTQTIAIDSDGTVTGGTDEDLGPIGQLKVVKFNRQEDLIKEGEGFYKSTHPENEPVPANKVKVLQGYTETSNASAVNEMIHMMEAVRTLEAYQKIIQSIDEADDQSVNNLARIA
ncbi:MAG: flagellar basal-body rod protein FlgF [Nitrospinota bacterium]|nr:flagellar basal-body rod protein FlgF [Nitrospinota bacterium]